jgi:hypothetical protein
VRRNVLGPCRNRAGESEAGTATIDAIGKREVSSKRHVQMTISLAFLAPSLVKAAVDGRLPRRIGVARLSMHRSLGRVSNTCWGSRTDQLPRSSLSDTASTSE